MHYSKDIENRLATAEGQLKAVRQMLKDERSCEDILIQLSAIESLVNGTAKIILKTHLNHCVKESIQNGEEDVLISFTSVLDKYL